MKGEGESPFPKPFSENLLEIVMIYAERWNISPFVVLKQDIDDFILIANYLIDLSKNKEQYIKPTKKNDGFWDF